jgi:hypothetical protein
MNVIFGIFPPSLFWNARACDARVLECPRPRMAGAIRRRAARRAAGSPGFRGRVAPRARAITVYYVFLPLPIAPKQKLGIFRFRCRYCESWVRGGASFHYGAGGCGQKPGLSKECEVSRHDACITSMA